MRMVIKLSSQLVATQVWRYCRIIADAIKNGCEIVVVSGGAVKRGMETLHITNLSTLDQQAASGIGQVELMKVWSKSARKYGLYTAQIQYTHHDLLDPNSNISAVIQRYFDWGRVLPVANGNDVAIDEEARLTSKVSENSGLAQLLARRINADLLVLLGLQKGIYTTDPRIDHDAQLIREVTDLSDGFLDQFSDSTPENGSFGGIKTNVENCLIAARAGIKVIVASGRPPQNLRRILEGKELGTVFRPARPIFDPKIL